MGGPRNHPRNPLDGRSYILETIKEPPGWSVLGTTKGSLGRGGP